MLWNREMVLSLAHRFVDWTEGKRMKISSFIFCSLLLFHCKIKFGKKFYASFLCSSLSLHLRRKSMGNGLSVIRNPNINLYPPNNKPKPKMSTYLHNNNYVEPFFICSRSKSSHICLLPTQFQMLIVVHIGKLLHYYHTNIL